SEVITTVAPYLRSNLAVAKPMPESPPVISAFRPLILRSIVLFILFYASRRHHLFHTYFLPHSRLLCERPLHGFPNPGGLQHPHIHPTHCYKLLYRSLSHA